MATESKAGTIKAPAKTPRAAAAGSEKTIKTGIEPKKKPIKKKSLREKLKDRQKKRRKTKKAGPKMSIFASRNIIAPGGSIELAAVLTSADGKPKTVNAEWDVDPDVPGIEVSPKGVLSVDAGLSYVDLKNLAVNVIGKYQKHKCEKEIRLVNRDPSQGACRLHYFRHDNDYDGWNVWAWGQGARGKQINFNEYSDFGKVAAVDRDNFIIRLWDWRAKDTGDMSFCGNNDVYVISGDPQVYHNFKTAINASRPRIISAIMDSKEHVKAYLTTRPPADTEFALFMGGKEIARQEANGKTIKFNIKKDYKFDPSKLFLVKATKMFTQRQVRLRDVLDQYYYDGDDMGVTYTDTQIRFRLWTPVASSVDVMIYEKESTEDEKGTPYPMKKDPAGNGTWTASVDRNENYGRFFKYRIRFNEKTDFAKTTFAVDPYAKAVGVNGNKGALIDPVNDPATKFDGWKPGEKPKFKHPTDAIIYEMHVRDFSIDENSGVKPEYKGKYMALTRKGTHHPGDKNVKTCMDHLVELGVTHVHVLPVYDYATVDETRLEDPKFSQYNWGYDPKNYNAPEGSYSTDPYDPATRIREMRKMIQALHDNDIRFVMDVVYNHTYDNSTFDPIVPGYYYRTDKFGHHTNGSGCGNEVASERPMVRKFIIDSVKYWAKNYNVDGFRFDLMGIIDVNTMEEVVKELHKIDPTILVYGEPWAGGTTSLSGDKQIYKGVQKGKGFAVFNDNIRNALRGDNRVPRPKPGYVTGDLSAREKVIQGVEGAINDFTSNPVEVINYAACHDNYTLWDQVISTLGYRFPHDPYLTRREDKIDSKEELFDERVKAAVLANGIVLTSQGVPFIHCGDEMLRTKFGQHNSYRSSDSINRVRWDWKRNYDQVFNYYKGLIKLRKEHPAFRMHTREQVEKHLVFLSSPNGCIAFQLKNNANGDSWKNIIVAYNPEHIAHTVNLPPGKWTVVVNDLHAGTEPVPEGYSTFKNKAIMPPLSMIVLHD